MPVLNDSILALPSLRFSLNNAWGWLQNYPERVFFVVAGLYFGLHVISRVLLTSTLGSDEAEQALWSQTLQWGYGAQPPLYTWLQYGFMQLFGINVLALALLKNALLFTTYTAVFVIAQQLLGDGPRALAATAGLLFIPQIAWESQRDLSHSVLVTTLAALTLLAVIRLLRRPQPASYLLVGLCLGLGILAKYNYVLFAAALLLTLVGHAQTRAILLRPAFLLTISMAGIIVLPHGLWVVDHWQATAACLEKLEQDRVAARAHGLLSAATNSVLFLLPFLLAAGLWLRPTAGPAHVAWRFPLRGYLVAVGITIITTVLLLGAGEFKDRWLQPLLFVAPVVWLGYVDPKRTDLRARLPGYFGMAAGLAVIIWLLIPLRVVLGPFSGYPTDLNQPYSALAQAIKTSGMSPAILVGYGNRIAGNLRLQFPEARVYAHRQLADTTITITSPAGPILAIWPTAGSQTAMPRTMHVGLTGALDVPALAYEQRRLQLPLAYSDGRIASQFNLAVISPP